MVPTSLVVLLAAIALIVGCVAPTTVEEPIGRPPLIGDRPLPLPPSPQDRAKSIILDLHVKGQEITVRTISVTYARARTYIGDPDQFRVKLINFSGQVIGEIRTWHPRGIFVIGAEPPRRPPPSLRRQEPRDKPPTGLPEFEFEEEEIFQEKYVILPEAEFALVIPFLRGLNSVEFTDRNNQRYKYKKVDLVGAIRGFCVSHPDDQECNEWLAEAGP